MLIELVKQTGILPKKVSNTNGGVFHSSCPNCGGVDRFTIWMQKKKYWCRGCNVSGDEIQFCRDFLKMSFSEARIKVGNLLPNQFDICQSTTYPSTPFYVEVVSPPSLKWKRKMSILTECLHQRLLDDSNALQSLYNRGLNNETIKLNRLGYLGSDVYLLKDEWGLELDNKKLWVPAGHIIPLFGKDGYPFRVKIRKTERAQKNHYGKYYHFSGGASNWMALYGRLDHPTVILVESEFDAMLVIQETGDLCCCVALGGASHRPDFSTYLWLKKKQNILFSLDFDEAGKKRFPKWQSAFPQLIPFPVPRGKSPEEAHTLHRINLKEWMLRGLKAHMSMEI